MTEEKKPKGLKGEQALNSPKEGETTMSTVEKEQKGITRRDFIKGAAAGGAAGLVVGAGGTALLMPAKEAPKGAPSEIKPWLPAKWDIEADVLIVGSGVGGLSAAIEASRAGAGVLILERYGLRGTLGRICAAGTKWQAALGIKDSPDEFFKDWMWASQNKADPELVRIMCDQSADGLHFLAEFDGGIKHDVKLGEGTLIPRAHMGWTEQGLCSKNMLAAIEKNGGKIMLNTTFTELFREGFLAGRVVGGRAVGKDGKEFTIKAKRAIIMATGRWREDEKMLVEHWPLIPKEMIRAVEPGVSGELGEGIRAGMAINASMRHMDYIQLAPYISTTPGVSNLTKAPMEIWVNLNGKRFTDESALRGKVAEDVFNQPEHKYFCIQDSNPNTFKKYLSPTMELVDTWVKEGKIGRANTIKELADWLEKKYGIPADAVVETVADYNKYCEAGVDLEFKKPKDALVKVEVPPFYGSPYTCQIAMTTGGFHINAKAQVLDTELEVIPGLYAGGMCCGGHHGVYSVMGNYQIDAIVFGRIAGKEVAALKPWA